nr:uncharacterized protein LOC127346666 [Lolium perenne]
MIFANSEDVADDDNNTKAGNDFFLGAGEEDANGDTKPKDVFFVGAREDRTGEEDTNGDAKPKGVFFEAGDSTREMTMDELVLLFHKETASLLRQAKGFDDQPVLASLMASCDAIGEQIRQGKHLDSTEGRRIIHKLIALHLRMVSCAGGVILRERGSSLPATWCGDRHGLPCKEKRAGTLMELLLYSMMLADDAMDRFVVVESDDADYVSFVGGASGDHTGEEVRNGNTNAKDVFFPAATDRIGEEVKNGDSNSKDVFFVGGGDDLTSKEVTNDAAIFGAPKDEMTLEELVLMFHKDTASILRQAKKFDDQPILASLIASCDAIGQQIRQVKHLDSPEGRLIVHKLIALHLRIVSCAGRASIHKPGASQPEMRSGDRHRLPCKKKLAGTLMEVLLYSMMLADAAMERFIVVEWDFTSYG